MQLKTKLALVQGWNWCDAEDKSTEFMFAYMSDTAGVEYDVAVDFVTHTTSEEREKLSEQVNDLIAAGYNRAIDKVIDFINRPQDYNKEDAKTHVGFLTDLKAEI